MQCEDIQNQLSAALDGELNSTEQSELERHLAECGSCREAMSALESVDVQFRRATVSMRDRAPHIATKTLSQLPPRSPIAPARPSASLVRQTVWIAAAAACGFLLAVALFRPGHQEQNLSGPSEVIAAVDGPPEPGPAPAVIRAATGPVEYSTSLPASWTPLAEPDGFACAPGVAVRTTDSTVCELETSSGATVRMNSDTQLAIIAADDLRLSQGEIWCRTSDASGLKVTSAVAEPPSEPPVSLVCGTDSPAICVFTCPPAATAAARMRVCVASGRIELVSRNRSERFDAGCSVEIQDGAMQKVATHSSVRSERWMHPLIVRKGPASEELAARVNELLAQVGQTKLSYLSEHDLRSLGEYGALPLLRYLQTNASVNDAQRRQKAAQILADVAPAWMTPELIELLADDDPAVRISAARGLQRLTGQTQGMTPESWGDPNQDLTAGVDQWRAWWKSERQVYPAPPAGVRL